MPAVADSALELENLKRAVGVGLASGIGVPRDLVDSYKWLSLARSADPENSVGLLAETMRDTVSRQMSAEEIERAKRRLSRFKPVVGPRNRR